MRTSNPYQPKSYARFTHPEWSRNAVIYQINTRQFTEEGTFRAAESHLSRLDELGVDILWLMPVHEIGQINRKGSLGSPYAVKDYFSVNPEFGTLDDLKHFVAAAHDLDRYVILDWVANHTAWDCMLTDEHPEWYSRDWKGDFHPAPWEDWSDTIDLDYQNEDLREYMIDAMKYWVEEVDIDGYRCDVAGFVPTDFWNVVRKELDAIKPVFMLAEWESRDLHANAFDMTYAWSWYDAVHNITMGSEDLTSLLAYYSWSQKAYPRDAFRMTFVSNHDKNAHDGTQFEQFGDGLEAAIVLSVIGEGMPLIYNGQEAGNPRQLKFYDKDTIIWQPHPIGDLYKKLITFKKQTRALWNGVWGARMIHVPNSQPGYVFSFIRRNEVEKVFAIINFCNEPQSVRFGESLYHGSYQDYLTGEPVELCESSPLELKPWGYYVLRQLPAA